jgi:hypothetical protein
MLPTSTPSGRTARWRSSLRPGTSGARLPVHRDPSPRRRERADSRVLRCRRMTDSSRVFLVARNPDADSKLPYLLRLPLEDGIVLKARESWPVTARVYCHRLEEGWPEQAELIEQTPVLLCRPAGSGDRSRARPAPACPLAVRLHAGEGPRSDLLANAEDRPRREPRRQDPAPAHAHRRGHDRGRHEGALPVPLRPASSEDGTGGRSRRRLRRARARGSLLAAVERKSLDNFAATLSDGTLAFQMQRLAELPLAAIVVEARYSALYKLEQVASHMEFEPTRCPSFITRTVLWWLPERSDSALGPRSVVEDVRTGRAHGIDGTDRPSGGSPSELVLWRRARDRARSGLRTRACPAA